MVVDFLHGEGYSDSEIVGSVWGRTCRHPPNNNRRLLIATRASERWW